MRMVISRDGTRIAYDKTGKGPTVILVLGSLNSRKSGARLMKLLAPRFTVMSYDRRRRGDSTDTAPYAPQREVEDLAALIDEAKSPVFLYGHSSGGALALEAAIALRPRVKKVAVYEVPFTLDREAIRVAKEYDKRLKKMLAAGRGADAVVSFIRHVGVSDKQIRAIKRLPLWRGLVALAPTLAYDSDILGKGHRLPAARLKRVAVPALVMHGGKGAPSMISAAKAISAAIPHARLRELPGQTHGVSPKALTPVLNEFFSE